MIPPVAERLRRAYPALLERAGVGSIPANSDAQNVPCFRRWRFEMKLCPFLKSSVVTEIRGKHSQLITSRATVTTRKQLRFRPCLADQLQYKTFDTNDPALPIDTIQRYPLGYDSKKWTQWKNMERTGRGRT
jgi:hypothetical protein